MTSLTSTQVRSVAKLARLNLSDAEVEKFTTELTSILSYVDMLKEVDTSSVEATAQVTGQTNSFREDVVEMRAQPDELLGTSPLSVSDHQIVSPSAHG